MTRYEQLLNQAYSEGVDVVEYPFRSDRIKGLYNDNVIGLNANIETSAEKTAILAEELGHHYTSCGNIIDLSNPDNAWQEAKARLWGYRKLISRELIMDAHKHGCNTVYEVAEYLEIPTKYLLKAMATFQLVEENYDLFENDYC